MTTPTVGAEALVKHVSVSPLSHGASYRLVRVTRVTKARVFVSPREGAPEIEFRLDNLKEYGEKSWRADELIVDPEKIAEARAEMAARAARSALESRALKALSEVRALFEGIGLNRRTEEEVLLLEALRDSLKRDPA